jgi:predicted flap endonuclease-1-like 5' DNA nuclease
MTFDTNTILIVAGAVLALLILVWLVLRLARRRQSIASELQPRVERESADPYAVKKERPYMQAPPPPAVPPPAPDLATDMTPAPEDDLDVAMPAAIPMPSEFAGIALPPHSTDHPDPLTRLKGVGPKLEAMLNDHGITRYEQLASLDDHELGVLEERLGAFKGRLTRDRVVEQARLLASGNTAEFEEKFGKLGGG